MMVDADMELLRLAAARARSSRPSPGSRRAPRCWWPLAALAARQAADPVGEGGRDRGERELAERAAPERPGRDPGHHAAADEGGDRGQDDGCGQRGEAEQVRQQRDQRADREGGQRRARGGARRRQLLVVDAELLADVNAQRLLRAAATAAARPRRPAPDRRRASCTARRARPARRAGCARARTAPSRPRRRPARSARRPRRTRPPPWRTRQLRARPGRSARWCRCDSAAAADTGDQRDVGDQSVHGAEHRRPQPATGHVPVLVHVRVVIAVAGRAPTLPGAAGDVGSRAALPAARLRS